MIKKIIQRNFTAGRRNNKIGGICLHTYGGKGTSLYNWFNKEGTNASAHYAVMKSGEIEQLVEDKDTSWHASNFDVNLRTIGIEHQDDGNSSDSVRTDALYKASAELVANLCKSYGIPCKLLSKEVAVTNKGSGGISLHRYYANKPCPGGLDVSRIIKEANNILNNNDMIKLTQKEIDMIKELRSDVVAAGVNVEEWYNSSGAKEFIEQNYSRSKDIENLNIQIADLNIKVKDLTKNRDDWKNNADELQENLTTTHQEVVELKARIENIEKNHQAELDTLQLDIKTLKTSYEGKLAKKNKEIEELLENKTIGEKINIFIKNLIEKLKNRIK